MFEWLKPNYQVITETEFEYKSQFSSLFAMVPVHNRIVLCIMAWLTGDVGLFSLDCKLCKDRKLYFLKDNCRAASIIDTQWIFIKLNHQKCNIPQRRGNQGLDGWTGEFYKLYMENIILIVHKSFQKIDLRELPNSLNEAIATLIPKPDRDSTRGENYWPVSLMNMEAIIFHKILATWI